MRCSRSIVLLVLVIGLACGDDGNAPPVPTGMVLASGNNQSGLPGITLALPLRVTVTGTGGAPFPGARVTWVVTTGSAGLGSPTDTTDANGEASTTVTVGVVPGNLVVTATVTGVPAVPFTLTALDPCDVLIPLSTDTVHTGGVLTNFDCQFNGPYFTDFYTVSLPGQAGLQVSMTAVYDTYVEQYHLSGSFIGVNDDLDTTTTNSRIDVIAAAGTYVFLASTYVGTTTGPYTYRVAPRAQSLTGCPLDPFLTWITRGVALTDQVQATDCATARPTGGTGYSDRVVMILTPARPVSATLASTAFNPRLELYELVAQPGGQPPIFVFRTSANGSGGAATLDYTPLQGAIFKLEITSVDTVQTGAYTLNVTGPAPVEASVMELPLGPAGWGPADAPARATRGKARGN